MPGRLSTCLLRQFLPGLMILCLSLLSLDSAVAQNENETVGFSSTHVYDGGYFGDSIDTLNGNLNFTIPIGPSYQVNKNLSYQLSLVYNSRVWEFLTHPVSAAQTKLWGESPFGNGFSLNLGRLYEDQVWVTDQVEYRWIFISPDGSRHDLGTHGPGAGAAATAIDASYYKLNVHPVTGARVVENGTGIRYTLGQHVNFGSHPCLNDDLCDWREKNAAYGGWYVTSIEDTTSGSESSGLYPNRVDIEYETTIGYGQCIKRITDTAGRIINFTTSLASAGEPRSARTTSVIVPRFGNSTDPVGGATATYTFNSSWLPMSLPTGTAPEKRSALRLNSLVTPGLYTTTFQYGAGNSELTMRTLPTNEAGSASGARIVYHYADYDYYKSFFYQGASGASGGPGGSIPGNEPNQGRRGYTPNGKTRHVYQKELFLADPFSGGTAVSSATWDYDRTAILDNSTNPYKVILTATSGAFVNDTVFFYRASVRPSDPDTQGRELADGYAPEWNDGLNHRIEYWEGEANSGRLLRVEEMEHVSDSGLTKTNIRPLRTTTTFLDDASKQIVTENAEWDQSGHVVAQRETGFGLAAARITRRNFTEAGKRNDVYDYMEVTDGNQVLSRSDYKYDTSGQLSFSIDRKNLPPAPQSPAKYTADPGDVVTILTYDTSGNGNILHKEVADGGDCPNPTTVPCSASFRVEYTYGNGGTLATKKFVDPDSGAPLSWDAIHWERDGNTGLIKSSCDPAGVCTAYDYDELGRIKLIKPPSGSGASQEYATVIVYPPIAGGSLPSFHETHVRQWSQGENTPSQNCNANDDCIETRYRYDDLARLVQTKKRDSTGGWTSQIRTYDALSNPTAASEWVRLDASDLPIDALGDHYTPASHPLLNLTGVGPTGAEAYYPSTIYDYTDLISEGKDPFGRAWGVESPDKKLTRTVYRGLDTVVTVKGINEPNGLPFETTTTYSKDALGRLVDVSHPSGRYTGSGNMLPLTAAKAEYEYDYMDNLVQVNLIAPNATVQQRSFEYDGLNRLVREDNPENGTTLNTQFDAMGNLLQKQDAAGTVTTLSYDKAGRLLESRGNGLLLSRNTYDSASAGGCTGDPNRAKGKLVKVESFSEDDATIPEVTHKYCFEALNGRLSSESTFFPNWSVSAGLKTSYTYNAFGLSSKQIYPDDATGRTLRDLTSIYKNGYLLTLKDTPNNGKTHVSNIQYNAAGGIWKIDLPKSQDIITPDARNRPLGIVFHKLVNGQPPTELFNSGLYEYDGAGNISKIGSSVFNYDEANRLVQSEDAYNAVIYYQSWNYDSFGNMLQSSLQVGSGSTATRFFTHNSGNQIQTLTEGGVATPFTYDSRGNVTQDKGHGYEYDLRNRLRAIYAPQFPGLPPTQLQGKFAYDAAGNRAVKTLNGVKTYYIRDRQGQVLSEFRKAEFDPGPPAWDRDYLYAAGRLVAQAENDTPDPPTRLAAQSLDPNWITLSWQAPADTDIQSFKVYRRVQGTPTYQLQGSPSGPLFQQNVPDGEEVYEYKVSAADTAGNESTATEKLAWMYWDQVAPSQPGAITAIAGDGSVALSWGPSTDNVQVLGYRVRRECGSGSCVPWEHEISPPGLLRTTSILDTGLTNGLAVFYIVTAVDSAGNTNYRTSATVTPLDTAPPAPPEGLMAQPGCELSEANQVYLSWLPNSTSDGVVEYRIFRDGEFHAVPDPPTSTTFDDTLEPGVTQATYTIVARDGASKDSVESQTVTVQLRILPTPPDPPDPAMVPPDPVASGGDAKVNVEWTGPTCTISDCKSFAVYRRLNMDRTCQAFVRVGAVRMDQVSLGKHSYLDTEVTTAVAYEYALAIINESGREGALSKVSLAVPLETVKDVYRCRPANLPGWCAPSTCPTEPAILCDFWVYHWRPVSTPSYQPYSATHLTAPDGFLKGYRSYRYNYVSNSANSLQWVGADDAHGEDYGMNFGRDVDFRLEGFLGGNKCHVFTAVYKVLINGTWQTMESGWSNNFEPGAIPISRCPNMYQNQGWCTLPVCESETFVPPPPTTVEAGPGPGPNQITVSWSPPLTAEEEIHPDLAGYYLYVKDPLWESALSPRHTGGAAGALFRSNHPLIRLDAGISSITIGGLKSCRSYSFYLASIGGSGRISEPSETSPSTEAQEADPWVPLGLRPRLWTSNDSYFSDTDPPNASTEKARLLLDESCDARIKVQKQLSNGTWEDVATTPTETISLADTEEWTFTLPQGEPTLFRYQGLVGVVPVNSPPVALEVLPHDVPPLSAPTHLDALVQNDGTIKLRWCPNPAAENISGYRVFRSTTSGGPYAPVSGTDILPGIFTWTDPGPITPSSTRYYYVIAAVRGVDVSVMSPENGAGNTSLLGEFDEDSWNWKNDQTWLSSAPTEAELLRFCNSDYVENRSTPPGAHEFPRREILACEGEPARLVPVERAEVGKTSESAPYRTVGSPGDPSFHYTYYHLDHLGSPRILTDLNGVKVQGQHFLPFGEEMPVEPGLNSKKFTGHEHDPETGLEYMMARYYQSASGRFNSPDPKGNHRPVGPQAFNLYSYTQANPITFFDESGLIRIEAVKGIIVKTVKGTYRTITGKQAQRMYGKATKGKPVNIIVGGRRSSGIATSIAKKGRGANTTIGGKIKRHDPHPENPYTHWQTKANPTKSHVNYVLEISLAGGGAGALAGDAFEHFTGSELAGDLVQEIVDSMDLRNDMEAGEEFAEILGKWLAPLDDDAIVNLNGGTRTGETHGAGAGPRTRYTYNINISTSLDNP